MWFLRICALIGLAMLWLGAWWLGSVVIELLRR